MFESICISYYLTTKEHKPACIAFAKLRQSEAGRQGITQSNTKESGFEPWDSFVKTFVYLCGLKILFFSGTKYDDDPKLKTPRLIYFLTNNLS